MTTTISNPPYNMKWKHPFFAQSQPRFDLGVPPESNANFAFIETALSQSERCVFLLPNGVTSTSNKEEIAIKENLLKANFLECVISLPGDMFTGTNILTCLLVFNRSKDTQAVQMIDLTESAVKETREQRGQFGSNHARVYTKEFNVLPDEVINLVLTILTDNVEETEISRKVSYQEIEANDFNLSPKRYFEMQETEAARRPYEDIVADLNRIISRKNGVKITINENIAKSLGVYDLALDFKNGQEVNKLMNEMMKPLNLKIEKENVVSLSRYQELKFEVKDFERLPEIISLFFNMWRQAILMLNNEENRLLAELRDALLPDLMSGKLEL